MRSFCIYFENVNTCDSFTTLPHNLIQQFHISTEAYDKPDQNIFAVTMTGPFLGGQN